MCILGNTHITPTRAYTTGLHIFAELYPLNQGGRTRLPKFKFSPKFLIGLHFILQIQIRKFKKSLLSYVKNYFNQKSVEVQP